MQLPQGEREGEGLLTPRSVKELEPRAGSWEEELAPSGQAGERAKAQGQDPRKAGKQMSRLLLLAGPAD